MAAASSSSSSSDPFGTPGFRFYPTEEELLTFYLRHRLANTRPQIERVIPVLDVYSHHPSDLRSVAGEASVRDTEQWFFFCPRAEREVRGSRPARTTPSGYWKATGSPSWVFSSANKVVGVKRTMVFYEGRAPTGTKTSFKMNEYKAVADDADAAAAAAAAAPAMASLRLRNEFSVCRLYISTGTLRSFDRRPLNPAGHNQAVHQHVPSSARAANTNLADDVIVITGQAENSHDSSSLGSRGIVDVDGSEDGAIDWSSLITTADDFSFDINFNSLITTADDFSVDINFNSGTIGAWPQI